MPKLSPQGRRVVHLLTFNSLFEMLLEDFHRLRDPHYGLSILYLRCPICLSACLSATPRARSFNSLFEMRHQEELPKLWPYASAFNSLFEMRDAEMLLASLDAFCEPFNSLFEMPVTFCANKTRHSPPLSILYLRC